MKGRRTRLALAALAGVGPASAAWADAIVVAALGTPSFKPGDRIAAGTVVEIPAGGSLRTLEEDDRIVEASGPVTVVIRSAGAAVGLLFDALHAGRALILRNSAASALADPWVINLGSGGGKCYRAGDTEVLVALGPGRPEGVYNLAAADDERRFARLRLASGGPAQGWPVAMLPLRPDAEYLMTIGPKKMWAGKIRLRRVDATGRDPKAVAADLFAAGCTEQAIALVRTLPPDERVGGAP